MGTVVIRDLNIGMKGLAVCLLMLFSIHTIAQDNVLDRRASVTLTHVTLEVALSSISGIYQTEFSYSDDVVPVKTRVSIEAYDKTLRELLNELLAGLPVEYKRANSRVVFRRASMPLTQTVRGVVVDQYTRIPIPGANIVIVDTQPLLGATTDTIGRFRIRNVPVGRSTIRATSIGYESRTLPDVLLGTGKELILEIGIIEASTDMAEVVVAATQLESSPGEVTAISGRTFSVEETKRYAGNLGDPARMAAGFPGVTTASDESNALIVRGNSPRGVLWRVDGLEVPNPNHFAAEGSSSGVVSILSANMIDNSDFLTGAFPATYGNALSAVFDMKLRTGNNEQREHSAQVGLLGLEASTEGPLSRRHQSSYLVNYRYSTLNVLDKLGVDLNDVGEYKNYQDLSFKVDLPAGNKGRVSIFGISGLSRANKENSDSFTNDDAGMGVVAATYEKNLGINTTLTTALSWSGTRISNYSEVLGLSSGLLQLEENYRKSYIRSSVLVGHKFRESLFLKTGFIYSWLSYNFYLRNLDPGNQAYQEIINFQEKDGAGISQAFVTAHQNIVPKVSAVYGIHFIQFGLTRDYSIEPRAGVRWILAPGKVLSAGYGKHSRIENLQYYLARDHQPGGDEVQINKNLGFSRANHFIIGYEQALSDGTGLKLETYYQQLYNVPAQLDPSSIYSTINEDTGFISDTLLNNGRGRNYGVEVSVERRLSKGLYYLVNGTVYQSKFQIDEQPEHNTAYNGNYNFHILVGKELKFNRRNGVLGLNIKITSAGGRRYIPIDIEASVREGRQMYDWEQALNPQLPAYFRTDFQIVYRRNYRRSFSEWRLDVQNITNHRNAAYYYYDASAEDVRLKYFVGFLPVLSYRIEF